MVSTLAPTHVLALVVLSWAVAAAQVRLTPQALALLVRAVKEAALSL